MNVIKILRTPLGTINGYEVQVGDLMMWSCIGLLILHYLNIWTI